MGGESYYPAGDNTTHDDEVTAALYAAVCTEEGNGSPRPVVCGSSALWRVIASPISGRPATIYGKTPIIAGGESTCAGDSLDFQTSLTDGWACVVAVVDDALGNRGISPPLRACFTTDATTGAPCDGPPGTDASDASDLPDCTDGCTLPIGYADFPGSQLVEPT